MSNRDIERTSVDFALLVARRRAEEREPSSPSWEDAMEMVEDLEREAFRLDGVMRSTARRLVSQS